MEYKFKIIMLGDYSSGKTSIVRRLIDEPFNNIYSSTIGVDFTRKEFDHNDIYKGSVCLEDETGSYKIEKKEYLDDFEPREPEFKKYHAINKKINKEHVKYSLMIWDTSGQEQFQTITSAYYRFISCGIFVFDLSNRKSFISIQKWYKELVQKLDPECLEYFPVIIVGNKSDLSRNREVSEREGQSLAHKYGGLYIECSAKEGINIDEVFMKVIKLLLFNINHEYIKPGNNNGICILHNDKDLFEDERTLNESRSNSKCCVIM
jgi:small GTP-binding protein